MQIQNKQNKHTHTHTHTHTAQHIFAINRNKHKYATRKTIGDMSHKSDKHRTHTNTHIERTRTQQKHFIRNTRNTKQKHNELHNHHKLIGGMEMIWSIVLVKR